MTIGPLKWEKKSIKAKKILITRLLQSWILWHFMFKVTGFIEWYTRGNVYLGCVFLKWKSTVYLCNTYHPEIMCSSLHLVITFEFVFPIEINTLCSLRVWHGVADTLAERTYISWDKKLVDQRSACNMVWPAFDPLAQTWYKLILTTLLNTLVTWCQSLVAEIIGIGYFGQKTTYSSPWIRFHENVDVHVLKIMYRYKRWC